MLQRGLTGTILAAAAMLTLTACGDEPIEDNLVRPGITAIDEARSETCGVNASALRTAIDVYTITEGVPPADEAALVPDYLRGETADWNVVDGELVPENPACGEVPEVTPIDDIVTSSSSAAAGLDGWSDTQIAQVGGAECAAELAAIFSAAERFVDEQAGEPDDLSDLVDAGYLDAAPTRWVADGPELVPVAGSGCTDLP